MVVLFCGTALNAAPAQSIFFTTLASFNGTYYIGPNGLVQASDGNFYGTTYFGGARGGGSVFKITPDGTLTTLYSFTGGDNGAYPWAGLVQGRDGNFYGTSSDQFTSGDGTIFTITPAGFLTTLHNFDGPDGSFPASVLVQAVDGNFYGTTATGGSGSHCSGGCGTVFRMTPGGQLTTLHSLDYTEGYLPWGLIQASDGNFYGTTYEGGAYGGGSVFKMTPNGTLTTMYSLCYRSGCPDGAAPYATVVQGRDGNFYGTTYGGGAYGSGTVFKMTPNGTLTTLYSFDGADGSQPYAGLIQASDGNFYGTTYGGGAYDQGTVFKIASRGTLTTLHSFSGPDGADPAYGSLVQGADGTFYGTTVGGGAYGYGTVFRLGVAHSCVTCRP
jgi:uncharacterized repeat protein (TIGR03803 family)